MGRASDPFVCVRRDLARSHLTNVDVADDATGYTRFKDLTLSKELGSGQFGSVRMATNRVTKARFAVKVMEKKSLSPQDHVSLASEVRGAPRRRLWRAPRAELPRARSSLSRVVRVVVVDRGN